MYVLIFGIVWDVCLYIGIFQNLFYPSQVMLQDVGHQREQTLTFGDSRVQKAISIISILRKMEDLDQ